MNLSIIQERLKSYNALSKQEERNALKEIYQEIALAGLSRSDFFSLAAFQGGTALRIVHNLRRFSEDLDFMLLAPNISFQWRPYLDAIALEFRSFGVEVEVKEQTSSENIVKAAFLKEGSFSRIFELTYRQLPSDEQKIKIKLEVDTHPPEGSSFENASLIYPYPFSLLVQDRSSLFASKCHALLCRPFNKGRDWFDFLWYLSNGIPINAILLKNVLNQLGPYKGKEIVLDETWLRREFEKKIAEIDWAQARHEVENFLQQSDRHFVANWSRELFLEQAKKLKFYVA